MYDTLYSHTHTLIETHNANNLFHFKHNQISKNEIIIFAANEHKSSAECYTLHHHQIEKFNIGKPNKIKTTKKELEQTHILLIT